MKINEKEAGVGPFFKKNIGFRFVEAQAQRCDKTVYNGPFATLVVNASLRRRHRRRRRRRRSFVCLFVNLAFRSTICWAMSHHRPIIKARPSNESWN